MIKEFIIKLGVMKIFLIFALLHILDFIMTVGGVYLYGYSEGNPLINKIMLSYGYYGFAFFFLITLIISYFLFKLFMYLIKYENKYINNYSLIILIGFFIFKFLVVLGWVMLL